MLSLLGKLSKYRNKKTRIESMNKIRKNKVNQKDDATDDDTNQEDIIGKVADQKLKSKVSNMVKGYEKNIKMKESLTVNNDAIVVEANEKAKVENAFECCMSSGRRNTPLPGKRIFMKSLDQKQPRDQNTLLKFGLGKKNNFNLPIMFKFLPSSAPAPTQALAGS